MVKEVWFQTHSFEYKELGALGLAESLDYLNRVDWPEEWRREAQKVAAQEECCPAGMGFRADDGPFLHVMPAPDGVTVLFEWDEPVRFLGIFRIMKHRDLWVERVAFSEIPGLLGDFFAGNYPPIRTRLSQLRAN